MDDVVREDDRMAHAPLELGLGCVRRKDAAVQRAPSFAAAALSVGSTST